MRKMIIALLFLLIPSVSAQNITRDDTCYVPAETVIEGDYFVLCRTLIVDGTINGRLYGIAAAAQLNGQLNGNVYLIAGQAVVRSEVAGDVHFAGGILQFSPESALIAPGGGISSLSLSTHIQARTIMGSIAAAGYQLQVDGEIAREVNYWGTALELNGGVGGDFQANVGGQNTAGVPEMLTLLRILAPDTQLLEPGLLVGDAATVGGTFTYTAPLPATILATLPQAPTFIQSQQVEFGLPPDEDVSTQYSAILYRFLTEIAVIFLLSILLLTVSTARMQQLEATLLQSPGRSLAVGLGAFIVFLPLMFLIFLATVIVALMLSAVQLNIFATAFVIVTNVFNLGVFSIAGFSAIYLGRALTALAVGQWVIRRLVSTKGTDRQRALAALVVGGVILSICVSLPAVGWLAATLAAMMGTGSTLLALARQRIQQQAQATQGKKGVRHTPPPITEDRPLLPGNENLPDGFQWWE